MPVETAISRYLTSLLATASVRLSSSVLDGNVEAVVEPPRRIGEAGEEQLIIRFGGEMYSAIMVDCRALAFSSVDFLLMSTKCA